MNVLGWIVPLVPIVGGAATWAVGRRIASSRRRLVLGTSATAVLAATVAAAVFAAATNARASYRVGGDVDLVLEAGPTAGLVAVLVAVVATVVTTYAGVHEPAAGLSRLMGLLVVFTGAMELLVLAADLLTLLVAWEMVAGLSWMLIGHDWRHAERPRAAAHAFNATRFGTLGLFLAAGAVFEATGTFSYGGLGELEGAPLHIATAGIVVAAFAKSAQVPFAPWLFSAMAGPTSVSALLHSSTMVAAGVYALIRLQPWLSVAGWFGPTLLAVGVATALSGGAVALLQEHPKKLLAASTSAQYGLMLVAVGAGFPVVAAIHLVAHAVFKAHLFLSAGVAMEVADTEKLANMRLGRRLRLIAGSTAVASLALAAVPPLGAAWSKEEIVATAGHRAAWVAVLVAIAGGLSAAYATRFQWLAFGPGTHDPPVARRPAPTETLALSFLAVASVALGALWLPSVSDGVLRRLGGALPSGAAWEIQLSVGLAVVAIMGTIAADRAGRLRPVGRTPTARFTADWMGLPTGARRIVVEPTLALAVAMAHLDDRVVDAGVRRAAAVARATSRMMSRLTEPSVDDVVAAVARTGTVLAGWSSRDAEGLVDGAVDGVGRVSVWIGEVVRKIQTGLVSHQYVVIVVALAALVLAAALGR